MCYSCRILGGSPESDRKYFIIIRGLDQNHLCFCLLMFQQIPLGIQLGQLLLYKFSISFYCVHTISISVGETLPRYFAFFFCESAFFFTVFAVFLVVPVFDSVHWKICTADGASTNSMD